MTAASIPRRVAPLLGSYLLGAVCMDVAEMTLRPTSRLKLVQNVAAAR